ncbi:MAG: peptidylprolyl isomerase [Cryomorphaceae bacterium MED-G14]|nr:MAG: peptidylprolyl isomerase [Cryomorphaceae bacterium MED-G14]
MIKIHRIIFIAIILLLISCVKKNKSNNTTLKKVEKKVIKSYPIKEHKPFILNDKNAIPFFFEYSKKNKENKVRIQTKYGEIDILLFDETPYHRSNFIYLTKKKYFDGTYFHRIVKNFIIQGGNSDSYEISKRRKNIGRYLLPPDTKKGFRHDRGVVSMPSSDIENPYKLASPYEFFIVQSKNGAYHLDKDYTPFGKVIRGINVVDKINSLETDKREWPFENIKIKVSIID